MDTPSLWFRSKENTQPDELLLAPRRGILQRPLLVAGAAAIATLSAMAFFLLGDTEEQTLLPERGDIFNSTHNSRTARYDRFTGAPARPMAACKQPPHENCVIDGDTFWLNGEVIRIANIDAPGLEAACAEQARMAGEAMRTLIRALDRQPITIFAQGRDREGRLLALIETPRGDVGAELLRWRVAERWDWRKPPREDWCS